MIPEADVSYEVHWPMETLQRSVSLQSHASFPLPAPYRALNETIAYISFCGLQLEFDVNLKGLRTSTTCRDRCHSRSSPWKPRA